ncbi:hypothetical protein AMS68_000892 [Peltaster fructicola]|uniref:Protein HGH1 homolog n=1 Tax=Peltaster fructicola TaxID=286661 RepID=A0A6H0XL70_9PEZI|nr:hypothetical protein AMS68_000892 [Peltaster fructicola]
MPTELEELVEFLHHGNTQIRQIAAENLVGYSTAQPSLFKRNQLEPIRDLKLLVKDYEAIAKNALTILVNLSDDAEVYQDLVKDDAFLESLLRRITSSKEPNANLMCMLLANLAKSSELTKLLSLSREVPKPLSTSSTAIDQLLDCFVKGAEGSYNKNADYDYLSYPFADLSKHEDGRKHFLTARKDDNDIVPLTKMIVFTEHKSTIRRRGVANTIKNAAFDVSSHPRLLTSEAEGGIGLLPYILLPLMGNEEYAEEDTEGMLDELQLLDPDKEREPQNDIIQTHLETLLLLTTTREGRQTLRDIKVYPIVRELHLKNEDEGVREGCDRLVQVLMRDEEGEGQASVPQIQEVEDEDEQMIEVL